MLLLAAMETNTMSPALVQSMTTTLASISLAMALGPLAMSGGPAALTDKALAG